MSRPPILPPRTCNKCGASNLTIYLGVSYAQLVGSQKVGLLSDVCLKRNYYCRKSSSSDSLMSEMGDFSRRKTACFRNNILRLTISMPLISARHSQSESTDFSQAKIAFFRKAFSLSSPKMHHCTRRSWIPKWHATYVSG